MAEKFNPAPHDKHADDLHEALAADRETHARLETGLVDTFSIPQLLRLIASDRLDPSLFATHHFALADAMDAYDTFADAANTNALKVVLTGENGSSRATTSTEVTAAA